MTDGAEFNSGMMGRSRGEIGIAGRPIGFGHPCFIIAEAGVNHNGDVALARELVHAAKECGADSIKFQTFKTERVVMREAPKAPYQLAATDPGESQFDMLKKLELSEAAHEELLHLARSLGLVFLSTPYSREDAVLLDQLGVSAFKVASGQIIELGFLEFVAQLGKPLILSTGMSTMEEVRAAVQVIRKAGCQALTLLHCTSNYPADPAECNLRAMMTMRQAFNLPVGYSDHTVGIAVAIASIAFGASVLEKHVTLDKNLPGPDHRASLDPMEFGAMVKGIKTVEKALGHRRKQPAASEAKMAAAMRRSLVATEDIPEGTRLVESMVTVKRPGTGLSPSLWQFVIGRRSRVAIPRDTLLALEMFE